MSKTPLILLAGPAGSGKDTVANILVENYDAIAIAQADPMKRLAKLLFGFTDLQLWGPSDYRNAVDDRAKLFAYWNTVWANYERFAGKWVADLGFGQHALDQLSTWLHEVQLRTRPPRLATDALAEAIESKAVEVYDQPFTPRFVLQTLGTEWGRKQSRDVWSHYAIRLARELLGGGFRYDRSQGLQRDPSYAGPSRVIISDGRYRNEIANVRMDNGAVILVNSPLADYTAVEAAGVKGHASEAELKSIPKHFFTHVLVNDKSKGITYLRALVTDLVAALDNSYHTYE